MTSVLLLSLTAAPASAASAEIPVGDGPASAAYSPDGDTIYITNHDDFSVSVIDSATNTVRTTIAVGWGPSSLATSPDGSILMVSNLYDSTVSVIDTASDLVTATIPVGLHPYGIVFSTTGDLAYVVQQDTNGVAVIDTTTNTIVGSDIGVGTHPYGIAITPDGSKLYVSDQATDTVSVISTATRIRTSSIAVGSNPFSVAISPDGTQAYVTNIGDNTISVIDVATDALDPLTPSIVFSQQVVDVEFAPSGQLAYVTEPAVGVQEIDTATNSVDTSRPPVAGGVASGWNTLAISPDGLTLILVNGGDDTVSVRDLPTPASITSSAPPSGRVGESYSFKVTATGRPVPTFVVSSGSLPSGLSLDSVSGVISGTPTTAATVTFSISAVNGVAAAATSTYTVAITPAAVLAATGLDAGSAGLLGGLAILLGGALVIGRRVRAGGRSS